MSDSPTTKEHGRSTIMQQRLSRRRLLATAAGAGAGLVVTSATAPFATVLGRSEVPSPDAVETRPPGPSLVPFEGLHQAGIERPSVAQAATVMAAFDVVSPDREDLRVLLRDLTARARSLAEASPPAPGDPRFPPAESGILGPSIGPAELTTTLSVGSGLFDERYDLADRRPRQLVPMPSFPNDQLDFAQSHGDLLVQVCAVDTVACLHALRFLTLGSRASMALRWMVEGFQRPNTQAGVDRTTTRNLMGFKDGTSNLVPGTPELAGRVWVATGRRADLGHGWQLPGRPHDPHVRGALGPHRAR